MLVTTSLAAVACCITVQAAIAPQSRLRTARTARAQWSTAGVVEGRTGRRAGRAWGPAWSWWPGWAGPAGLATAVMAGAAPPRRGLMTGRPWRCCPFHPAPGPLRQGGRSAGCAQMVAPELCDGRPKEPFAGVGRSRRLEIPDDIQNAP